MIHICSYKNALQQNGQLINCPKRSLIISLSLSLSLSLYLSIYLLYLSISFSPCFVLWVHSSTSSFPFYLLHPSSFLSSSIYISCSVEFTLFVSVCPFQSFYIFSLSIFLCLSLLPLFYLFSSLYAPPYPFYLSIYLFNSPSLSSLLYLFATLLLFLSPSSLSL